MDESKISVVSVVKEGPDCSFVKMSDGVMHYQTSAGFLFRVPVADLAGTTVQAKERTSTFIKWIKKEIDGGKN